MQRQEFLCVSSRDIVHEYRAYRTQKLSPKYKFYLK